MSRNAFGGTVAPINEVAARVIQQQAYKPEALLDLIPALDSIEREPNCYSPGLRSNAVIRLRIAENTLDQGDGAHIDERFSEARNAIVKSLSCSPSDAFLWLSLYWVEVVTNGFRPAVLDLLRMSYRQGPNEGWVIEKRNRLALSVFSALPADLAEFALDEFTKLLQPEFQQTALRIFTGPGWPVRDRLLARMEKAPLSQRQLFANLLLAENLDVIVPGVGAKGFAR